MDAAYRKLLERQGYNFVGEHSACKTCLYTAKSIAGKGSCYKQKFYGMQSHRCIQMSTAVNFCNLDCVFCWRKRNNSPFGKLDAPKKLADSIAKAQRQLLAGFGSHPTLNVKKWRESEKPLHVAISLNGESTAYPRLGEFIKELHSRGYTTFLVTNGMLPEALERMTPPTQLYVSLSAPNEALFRKINRPMQEDGWQRLMKSLELLGKLRKKTRTAIRLTVINGVTMLPERAVQFAKLVKKANPMFLEVKSYSWLGSSRERLGKENVSSYREVKKFAQEVGKRCGYKFIDGQEESRVVLMMKKDSAGRFLQALRI